MVLKVEIKGLGRLRDVVKAAPQRFREGLGQFLGVMAEKVKLLARGRIRNRSGVLSASLFVSHPGLMDFTVSSAVEYARYVESGTRPHTIYPRFAKALRFEVGGEVVFSAYVYHPGSSPKPFLAPSLQDVQFEIESAFKDKVEEWLGWRGE